jgi:hypothetical protein
MAREFAKQFYHSAAWEKCRKSFISERIATDGGFCQVCGSNLGFIVHHKIKLTPKNINDPSIALAHSNLMYVCHDCHDNIHFHDMHDGVVRFGSDGQPLPPLENG